MDSHEFVRHAGNNSNTAALAAAAANAAKPNSGDPMKIVPPKVKPTSTSGSSMGDILAGSQLDSPYDNTPTSPAVESSTSAFPPPGMPNYAGGFPGGPPPNPFGYGFFDPMMGAAMGKGMPMMGGYPTMMPMGMPGMFPHPMMTMGMMPPMTTGKGGGKNQSKDQGKEKRRRPARKKNAKDKDEANEVDESSIVRSKELTEVRNAGQGKCRLTLQEVMPQVVEFATDQHGSRFLQTCLDNSTDPAEKSAVLEAILPQIKVLAKDQYGNFVIQKLFEVIQDKKVIADQLDGEVVSLAMDVHGCRVIQKALQLLPRDAQTRLAAELQAKDAAGVDKVAECIHNMHGNHVIQKCIEQMPPDSVNFIIDSVSNQVDTMAEHMYGCRIIQRLLEHCAPHQLKDMLERIMNLIKHKKLVSHPFGNYVVQHMLEHGRPEDKKRILEVVTGNIFEFSTQKCSSNVVEKCFEIASIGEHADSLKDERRNLYNAVLQASSGNPNYMTDYPIRQLTDDKFGNYIVQRMMEYSRDPERQILQTQLVALAPILQNSTNGKHICSALEKDFHISLTPDSTQ